MRGWTCGNATLAVRTYDQDCKITQVDSGGLKTYAYDDAFRITGITDTVERIDWRRHPEQRQVHRTDRTWSNHDGNAEPATPRSDA